MWLRPRKSDGADSITNYVNPEKELNWGLWSLFAGATVFLMLRLYCKVTRRHGLWYDDYILVTAWSMLLLTDALIVHQYHTGYVPQNGSKWDDRMHILINISSCTNLIGQSWSKTAFGVTLLKLTNRWQQYIIWFCIFTMNAFMLVKLIFQWAKLCDEKSYDVYYRLDFCIEKTFRDDFKEAGNIYNIIMDFVFAFFPWWITWKLDMRKNEKIGLCVTMSLGVIVAIVAAIRTAWKDQGNKRDPLYYHAQIATPYPTFGTVLRSPAPSSFSASPFYARSSAKFTHRSSLSASPPNQQADAAGPGPSAGNTGVLQSMGRQEETRKHLKGQTG